MAREVAAYSSRDLVVVAILKGSFIFAADLIRALHREGLTPEIDFIFLASYGGGTSSGGEVKVLRDVETVLRDLEVMIVDDILDSGRTLAFAKALLEGEECGLLLGDYNVIPEPKDCWNPAVWATDALFLPQTRAAFRRIANLGFTDALRAVDQGPGIYTMADVLGL